MKIYPQNKEQTRGVQAKFSIIIFFYSKIHIHGGVLNKVLCTLL